MCHTHLYTYISNRTLPLKESYLYSIYIYMYIKKMLRVWRRYECTDAPLRQKELALYLSPSLRRKVEGKSGGYIYIYILYTHIYISFALPSRWAHCIRNEQIIPLMKFPRQTYSSHFLSLSLFLVFSLPSLYLYLYFSVLFTYFEKLICEICVCVAPKESGET